jgi:minor extracellular serine protease Vpr
LRRHCVSFALLAALLSASAASASFEPLHRDPNRPGWVPRVRHGTITPPAGHAAGRVTVIVTLRQPPLARAAEGVFGYRARAGRLDLAGRASRSYLARLAAAQAAAVRTLQRAIPEASVGPRYRIVLDGFAVTLPYARLPRLAALGFPARIYPSLRYTLTTNESPAIIGADVFQARTGDSGQGMKIGVVDDGVDSRNPFFNPKGFKYPAGFPKGGKHWTTPKVIVARAFPGPGSGRAGRLALDPQESFHGTHVAGIAAGDAGTFAPRGPDHPREFDLSGVAPHAWIGNYRVFTVPSPQGNVANTPQIVEAYEWAVKDGMDVVNFSGGGPSSDPARDALIPATNNLAAAGVVPVISAGNDREEFGLGSIGSPGTAPRAIAVASVASNHLFGATLMLTSPDGASALQEMAYRPAPAPPATPGRWENFTQTLVDVSTLKSTNGRPVDPHLCGPARNPNRVSSVLLAGSLKGRIALVRRGYCSLISKAQRAKRAGAIGVVIVNDRGEADWPLLGLPPLPVPMGMVADIDGARLQAALDANGGRAQIRVTRDVEEFATGRGGVISGFSSGGPTDFGHLLKPDISAPGGSILSSTVPEVLGSTFAVFDGTSMAAPHISGAAALLLQHHPSWTPAQVKSALVQSAGPAFADTAKTTEAPVPLEGGGLASLPQADDPRLFADPVSLSFGDLNVNRGARSRTLTVTLRDAGNGGGVWRAAVAPQSASAGASVSVAPIVSIAPGGTLQLQVTAAATAGAAAGDDYGFVTLSQGRLQRRIPYLFLVTSPQLQVSPQHAVRLKRVQRGDTRRGKSYANSYRYPSAPFGTPPNPAQPPVEEPGAERLYVTAVRKRVANLGVAVVGATPAGALIHPWLLGARDENQVQGYAGTPVNVNGFMYDYLLDIGAAGVALPRPQRFFVSVDSGVDFFSRKPRPGRYVLRYWVNDVRPPTLRLLTREVAAGRPLIAVRTVDTGAGVDPYSLQLAYRLTVVQPSTYDPQSGIALFPLQGAPRLSAGSTGVEVESSDYQEAKNVNTIGSNILPNTRFLDTELHVVRHPVVTWLLPAAGACTRPGGRLIVTASATRGIASVRFFSGKTLVARARLTQRNLYSAAWPRSGTAAGRRTLQAVVVDAAGRRAMASRTLRVC